MRVALPAAVAILAIYPFMDDAYVSLLTIVFAKALPVLGIILLLQAGQVSFGHALYFAVGAYTMGFLQRDVAALDLVLLLPVATAAAAFVGLGIGVFVVRYRYIFFAMLNLAFSMVLYSLLEKFFHITGGTDGLRVERPTVAFVTLDRTDFEYVLYFVGLALITLALVGCHRLLDSPIGHTLKAIKTNETRVEYLGLSPRRVLLVFYVVSAALAGLGGALVAVFQGLATPDYAYWTRSGEMVFVAILGGAGNVVGALVGSAAFEFIRSSAAAYVGDYWQLTLGIVLLVIILFQPSGIVGLFTRFGRRRPSRKPATVAEAK